MRSTTMLAQAVILILALPAGLAEVSAKGRAEDVSLLLHLLDYSGEPTTGELKKGIDDFLADGLLVSSSHDSSFRPWPRKLTPIVVACATSTEGVVASEWRIFHEVTSSNEFTFRLKANSKYLVGVQGPGFDGSLQVVETPAAGGHLELTLSAVENLQLGRVSVNVDSNQHDLNASFSRTTTAHVEIEDIQNGAVVLAAPNFGVKLPFTFELPVGRYRASVEGRAGSGFHGNIPSPRRLGRDESTVVAQLNLQPGGTLEVTLRGEADHSDLAVTEARHGGPFMLRNRFDPIAASSRAFMYLSKPQHRNVIVHWGNECLSYGAYGSYGRGPRLDPEWPLGETNTSRVLPAGLYQLTARLPGGRELSIPIDLRSGALTEIELSF